jgi:hypothetical protein
LFESATAKTGKDIAAREELEKRSMAAAAWRQPRNTVQQAERRKEKT